MKIKIKINPVAVAIASRALLDACLKMDAKGAEVLAQTLRAVA